MLRGADKALRTPQAWTPAFLDTVTDEAAPALALSLGLERAWYTARVKAAEDRRCTSRATAAVELLAAPWSWLPRSRPTCTTVKNAVTLLNQLREAEIAVEVTHTAR